MKKELNLKNLNNVSGGGVIFGDRLHDIKDIKGVIVVGEEDSSFAARAKKARLVSRIAILTDGKLEELASDALSNVAGGTATLGNLPHHENNLPHHENNLPHHENVSLRSVIIVIGKDGKITDAYGAPIAAKRIVANPQFSRLIIKKEVALPELK